MGKVHKIVLTGGPCGGKTTALAKITEYFADRGFRVFRVPEAATMFIMGGAAPWQFDPIAFQTALIKTQMQLEDTMTAMAEETERAIVLCDRGHMDAAAYVDPETWRAVLDGNRWTTVGLRDERYDAIVHLVTAADGAPDAYTTLNNAARTETPEQAIAVDKKLLSAWVGSPHLRVVDNSTDFDEKIKRAIRAICRVVGVPEPLEDERKYLVRSVGSIPVTFQDVEIEQTYLIDEGERVRRRGQDGANIYFHTIKRKLSGSKRTEIERQITPREYVELLKRKDPSTVTIHKTRCCFVWEGQYFELDSFIQPHPKLQLLEAELDEGQTRVPLPPFITIERDVTEDPNYTNRALASAKGSVTATGRP